MFQPASNNFLTGIYKTLFVFTLVFSLVSLPHSYAANPAAPFSPSDHITDPNCSPTDSNCYVSVSNLTLNNSTSTNLVATNATSSNLFSTLLSALTATFNTLTGGSITTTSSLASQGSLTVAGNSNLSSTNISDLTVSGQTNLSNVMATGVVASNIYSTGVDTTNANITNATSSNFFTSILNAVAATFADIVAGNITATSSLTSNGPLTVSGTSTLATTTATKLTVSGATSLTNATSTNFFTSILNAITSTFNTLTGGNITATSSLVSNGTLAVTGTSTLATTTATNLTVSGQTTLNNASANNLSVTNLNVTNISSPSIITGTIVATSSLSVSATSTFATTTIAKLTVTGDLISASSTVTGTSTSQSLSSNFANIVTAIINTITASVAHITTATISALTGGSATFGTITATSSLSSQGTLSALGTTTLNVLDMNNTRIMNLPSIPTGQNDAASKAYVDSFSQGISWQAPVIAFATSSAPGSPAVGDRYILNTGATGFGTCVPFQIAQWNGTSWTCIVPAGGWSVYVNTLSSNYNYNASSSNWVSLGSTINHQTLVGLQGGNGSTEEYHLNLADYNALHTGNPQLAALQTIGAPSFAGLTITSSSTRADAFNVTGTSTITGNLVVSGNISAATGNITNLTAPNVLSSAVNSISGIFSALIGGSVTATSSLASNGTFSVTGTSTLATTTATSLAISNLTSGSVPFVGASGLLSQNNANLFWDNTNGRLGVGTNTPTYMLDVNGDIRSATGNYYTNANGTSNLSGLKLTTFGVNTVGNALVVNDINGAKYALGTGGYDLTFYKHKADDNNWYKSFVIKGSAANNYPVGYSFYTGNGVQSVVIDASGNLGIGTTTPTGPLSIQGVATFTTATTTFTSSGGINLTNGCFAINGVCVGGSGSGSGTVGSGTTGQFPFYAANGTTLTATSTLFLSTTNGFIGVGTSTPLYSLDVNGSANISAGSAYKYNGQNIAIASTTLSNYFFGRAGNITMTGFYNTASGFGSLQANTTGSRNTSNGVSSLLLNTIGSDNTASGFEALKLNTAGTYNTAFGSGALRANTTGNNNTATGLNALQSNTTGNNNTAFGYGALNFNTTGTYNTAAGQSALSSNTTGSYNTASGVRTLFSNTTGNFNTASGYNSLSSNTTGSYNISYGYTALFSNTTGINNTASGYSALLSNTTGNNNTASGLGSLQTNTTGLDNTAFGYAAGYGDGLVQNVNNRSVIDNQMLFIGSLASRDISVASTTALTNGIAIGYNAKVLASNQAVLGNDSITTTLLKGKIGVGTTSPDDMFEIRSNNSGIATLAAYNAAGVNTLKLIDSGFLAVGTTSPAYMLHVASSTLSGVVARFQNSAGYCDINPLTTSLTCTSDERLKKNITSLNTDDVIAKFTQLNPVTYNWKVEEDASSTHAGFIAQQVKPLFPDLVATDDQGTMSVSYSGFIPYIVNVLKSVVASVVDVKNTIAGFANRMETKRVQTDEICIGGTCLNEAQVKQLLNAQGINSSQSATPSSEVSVTPSNSSLILNGASVINLSLGEKWIDLGANFTREGNVEPVVYSTSTLDTSVVGTTTIDYFASYTPVSSSTMTLFLHATRDIVVSDVTAPVATSTASEVSSTTPAVQ